MEKAQSSTLMGIIQHLSALLSQLLCPPFLGSSLGQRGEKEPITVLFGVQLPSQREPGTEKDQAAMSQQAVRASYGQCSSAGSVRNGREANCKVRFALMEIRQLQ